jgi:GMP synthase (glutamine-hydrolysing)
VTATVLLIQHMDDGRDDRVAGHLSRRGFTLEWCNPARGDPLPEAGGGYAAAVVYGGIQSANDAPRDAWMRAEIEWIRRWVLDGGAYLGLCLGGQLLARALGAEVGPHADGLHEIGFVPVQPTAAGLDVFPGPLHVYQWHNEGFTVPDGGELLARGEVFSNQAFRVGDGAFGLQFHPEATARMRGEWLDASAHTLVAPGAHPRARQERDARRFDEPMEDWLLGFIDGHVLPIDEP